MAVGIPSSPLVLPTDWENRGNQFYSPSTKSTYSVVSIYTEKNICDADSWRVFTANLTLNQLIDCVPVLAGQLTISGRIPVDGIDADYTTMNTFVSSLVTAAI